MKFLTEKDVRFVRDMGLAGVILCLLTFVVLDLFPELYSIKDWEYYMCAVMGIIYYGIFYWGCQKLDSLKAAESNLQG